MNTQGYGSFVITNRITAELLVSKYPDSFKYYEPDAVLGCPMCGPNSGCNKRYKDKQRSWKEYRKTRWK